MNMKIVLFKIIIIYAIEGAHRADIAEGCLGRLLHHISKLPGQQELSLPRHYIYLDLQGISSYAGPGQATYDSYLILFVGIRKGYLLFSQVFFQIVLRYLNGAFLILKKLSCCLSAYIPNPTLQIADSRLPGIIMDDFLQAFVTKGKLSGL